MKIIYDFTNEFQAYPNGVIIKKDGTVESQYADSAEEMIAESRKVFEREGFAGEFTIQYADEYLLSLTKKIEFTSQTLDEISFNIWSIERAEDDREEVIENSLLDVKNESLRAQFKKIILFLSDEYKKVKFDNIDIVEVAKDIFNTAEMIEGYASGGINPMSHFVKVTEFEGKVTLAYQYDPVCGLSDRPYHTVQDIQKKEYEFDSNGIFKGDIYKELNRFGDSDECTLGMIEDFFKKNPKQRVEKKGA